MEVHSPVVADIMGYTEARLCQKRKRNEASPPYEKRAGRFFYPLGKAIRFAINAALSPLADRLAAVEVELAALRKGDEA